MNIIGIDPGLASCGFAVLGGQSTYTGTWKTKKLARSHANDLEIRVTALGRYLRELVDNYPNMPVAIEGPYFFGGKARDLGIVWGALIATIPDKVVIHVTPQQVRKHFCPGVKLKKVEFHKILRTKFPGFSGSEHALDALAVASTALALQLV